MNQGEHQGVSQGTNQGWIYRDRVTPDVAGQTVLQFYTKRYPHSDARTWEQRILDGQIRLNHCPTTPTTQLRAGQCLAYHRPPWQEPQVSLTYEIVHEDPEVLVAVKSSGLPVLPGGGFLEHTLLRQLAHHYPQQPPIPIHRLGRGTSGLILLARTKTARAHLTAEMQSRHIVKIYRALVSGNLSTDTFHITQPIGKIPYPTLEHLYAASDRGLFAHSEGRVLKRYGDRTLVEVTITTGRPHQIRIHMAWLGHPLVGDPLYIAGGIPKPTAIGEKLAVPGDCGYHLHACSLEFTHPNGRQMHITSEPPAILSE